jgi:hypothetical protein
MKLMKAPIAQAGEEATFSSGCTFFFWGIEIVKCI